MSIVEEKNDNLTSTLKIEVKKEDYSNLYSKALRDAGKEVSMPGFRPGKVPKRVIEKKYGKSILVEEINKLVNDSIYKHITENKLEILGNPIPKENGVTGDWDNPEDFSFEYEMGYAPEVNLSLSKHKIDYIKVKIDDKLLNKEIDDLRKRFGSLSSPEKAEEDDLLIGTLVELNDDKTIKEGGLMAEATISLEYIENKKTRKALTGAVVGSVVVVDPHHVFPSHADMEKIFEISHAEVHDLKSLFNYTVKEVKRMNPADLNQDLFDKAFGKDVVKTEDELRAKVKDVLEVNFVRDQDYIFRRDVTDLLVEKSKIELPDEFMKRWIIMTNEKPLTPEDMESDYPHYANNLKWQLIEGKIAQENEVKITREDLIEFQKDALGAQYAQYGMPLDEDMLNQFAESSLENKEEAEKISRHLLNERIIAICKEEMKVKDVEVDFDEFLRIAKAE